MKYRIVERRDSFLNIYYTAEYRRWWGFWNYIYYSPCYYQYSSIRNAEYQIETHKTKHFTKVVRQL